MYEQRSGALDRIISSIVPLPQQVGAVFTIRGMIAGFDAFDSPATWARTMPKLLRSYGLDALDTAIGGDGFATPDPQRFLEAVSRATSDAGNATACTTPIVVSSAAPTMPPPSKRRSCPAPTAGYTLHAARDTASTNRCGSGVAKPSPPIAVSMASSP